MFASQYHELYEEIFRILVELLKIQFNVVSLSFCSNEHKRISFPHPLPF